MPYANSLLVTIVLGLALAACGGFLARKMRMPPLVGYLVAGIAIGPFTPGLWVNGATAFESATFPGFAHAPRNRVGLLFRQTQASEGIIH
jgi:predicted Kef-type K+ transport protein